MKPTDHVPAAKRLLKEHDAVRERILSEEEVMRVMHLSRSEHRDLVDNRLAGALRVIESWSRARRV